MWNERNKDGTLARDHVGGWWKVSIQEKLNKESGSKEDSRDSLSLSFIFKIICSLYRKGFGEFDRAMF